MADKQIYKFTNDIDEVEITSLGADIVVKSTDESTITAEYENPNDKPEFYAVLSGKTLSLREKCTLKVFSSENVDGYLITVNLPKKLFKKLKVNSTNGNVTITDTEISAENLSLCTASGEINIGANFDNTKVKSASGDVTISGVCGKTAQSLKISTVSGEVNVFNYPAEKYSISSISGKMNYSGASGEGNINVTSGNVEIGYSAWTDDLKISSISGDVNVMLPEGSGAEVKFDGISGVVKTDLNSTDGMFMNLGRGTNGEFGGSNKHKVNVSLVSGTVTIAKSAFVEQS